MGISERLLGYLLIGIIGGGSVLTLITVGWILSKTVFPMFGQWIIDLSYKMRNDGQRNREWMQGIKEKFEKDRAMILKRLEESGMEECFETEKQIAKVLLKKLKSMDEEALFLDQCKERKDGKINMDK